MRRGHCASSKVVQATIHYPPAGDTWRLSADHMEQVGEPFFPVPLACTTAKGDADSINLLNAFRERHGSPYGTGWIEERYDCRINQSEQWLDTVNEDQTACGY